MNENADLKDNNNMSGENLEPVFLKSEEINKKKEQTDYSGKYYLPSIKTRYFSMLIDLLVILLISLAISALFEKIGEVPNFVRIILFVFVVILYEPLMVSSGATIGQLLLNIRVRNFGNPKIKLAFPLALIRTIVKVFLGWLSFLTVTFNRNRRAIHDFASNSIVIAKEIEVR